MSGSTHNGAVPAPIQEIETEGFAGGGGSGGGGGGGGFSGGGGGYYGGGSSGSSGSNDPFSFVIFLIFIIVFFTILIASRSQIKKRQQKMKDDVTVAGAVDPAWNEDELLSRARSIWVRYQADWENYDLASMRTYMTDSYYRRAELMVLALQQIYRKDSVRDISISSVSFGSMNDSPDNSQDSYSATISASGNDTLIDTRDGTELTNARQSITETYTFIRSGNDWLLDSIDESTDDVSYHSRSMLDFAAQHGFFYSPDWGRLLLPRYGSLFDNNRFTTADINNHCIGMEKGLLVQLYSYDKTGGWGSVNYVIAQLSLPKAYGRIIVRHRSRFGLTPKGMVRIKTEWNDFNVKFDVFASDPEKVTSFELLNPGFMQRLEGYFADINMEVVDNSVFLYTKKATDDSSQYQTMFSVLEEAFKELKM